VRAALAARGAALTTSSGVYDEPCAEHALAMMLALARRLPQALDAQRTDRGWDGAGMRAASRLLVGERVVLLGFGAIARRLVELLAPFRMDVVAVRRRARGDEPVRVVAESELEAHLAAADHVVNVLPGGAGTARLVDARRVAAMKPGARFYNVGRGTTVDQDALVAALCSGQLGAAYLDVTDPEPLPPDHPLWAAPNCYITPHSAGGQVREMEALVEHFLANLRRFAAGAALLERVL
jgi:phosphoglycerate dehydrogenase-like enzyme